MKYDGDSTSELEACQSSDIELGLVVYLAVVLLACMSLGFPIGILSAVCMRHLFPCSEGEGYER